jgi:hypothetical protein
MVGMETLRCPTCVTLLPDPDVRRCPACHTKLRKRRGRPIVLGESNRLSGRSLPVDVELRVRAEARYETFEPKAKSGEPLEALLAFAPTASIEPPPLERPEPEPLEIEPVESLEPAPLAAEPIVLAAEPIVLEPDEPPVAAEPLAAELPEIVVAEPEPEPEPAPILQEIDLTEEPEPVPAVLDLTSALDPEPAPDPAVRPLSGWQAVPARSAPSPLDGTLTEMIEELHRKARADAGNQRTH